METRQSSIALWRRLVFVGASLFDVTPEKLHVVVVAVANVARDIKVLAANIGRGVEQVHEVAAADDGADDVFLPQRSLHATPADWHW